MFTTIMTVVDALVLIIFGVAISSSFLGIQKTRKNAIALILATLVLIAMQVVSYQLLSVEIMRRTYPLFVHLPLILFYQLYFKKKPLSATLGVVTAYLCCQVSKWLALAIVALPGAFFPYEIYHVLFLALTGLLIIRFVASSVTEIFNKSTRALVVFGALPIAYYLFDYASTVFSDALYRNVVLVSEFMPFTLAVAYLAFCVIYYRQYEQTSEAQQHTALLEMQKQQSIHDIETMQRSEHEIALLRHDMRHYIDNIAAYVEAGNTQGALHYMNRLERKIDETKMIRFCSNELINTVLSTYASRMKDHHIEFDCLVEVGETLPCSEIDFTSLLANALENALKATIQFCEAREKQDSVGNIKELNNSAHKAQGSCTICLKLDMSDHKLLMSLTNPFTGTIHLRDGMPLSNEKGHGLGTESITYVASKLKGNCQYSTHNDIFTLRVVV